MVFERLRWSLSVSAFAVVLSVFLTPAVAAPLDPQHEVPADLLQKTWDYYQKHRGIFDNQSVISIVDYRPRSDSYRFFIVHLSDGHVEKFHTAHGSGSIAADPAFAVRFGNEFNSNRSSLGFARTGEVYYGSQHRSLRLDGLSASNSNLRERAIVVHGADQVREEPVVQGLGGGCLMLDWKVRDRVIDLIRDGSLIYFGLSAQ